MSDRASLLMNDTTQLPDQIYPNAGLIRSLIVIGALATITFGVMWLFQ